MLVDGRPAARSSSPLVRHALFVTPRPSRLVRHALSVTLCPSCLVHYTLSVTPHPPPPRPSSFTRHPSSATLAHQPQDRHSRGGGNPSLLAEPRNHALVAARRTWIPACAGMTCRSQWSYGMPQVCSAKNITGRFAQPKTSHAAQRIASTAPLLRIKFPTAPTRHRHGP